MMLIKIISTEFINKHDVENYFCPYINTQKIMFTKKKQDLTFHSPQGLIKQNNLLIIIYLPSSTIHLLCYII